MKRTISALFALVMLVGAVPFALSPRPSVAAIRRPPEPSDQRPREPALPSSDKGDESPTHDEAVEAPLAQFVQFAQFAQYPWLADDALGAPEPEGRLDQRIAPPPGFVRAQLTPGSFGAWLRNLPLSAPSSPVKSYAGATILPADHPHLAAVVALDTGAHDLQQCADSIIRLHAEWRFSRGDRDIAYRAASGKVISFARFSRGERLRPDGASLRWTPVARPSESHTTFRAFLDTVFTYANTGALARDTKAIPYADLRPGDFVVQAGAPGHAVLILDLATAPDGRRAVLLGQGFMPAQSFHVLRPSRQSTWFVLDEQGLSTPFWPTFSWAHLRRFPEA